MTKVVGPPPSATDRTTLGLLHVPKASDVLAEDLAARISSGELAEGDLLPPERSLVAQTGLSRTSVREALRVLEVRGFLEIRAGRGGGAVVRRPTGHLLADSVRLVVRGSQVSLAALLQTRATVEPPCAGLAALRRTPAGLRQLEESNRLMSATSEVSGFLRANVDWHMTVARESGNELLSGLMEALAELIYDSTGVVGQVDARVRTETCRAHQAITAAVRSGDRALARHRMARHVEAYVAGIGDGALLDWTGSDAP
ncbi:FadR/GntR family transcriptional regulator [Nocardioides nitrophenolicus]|uniref:FadR/GntR family transcriptional regulator n=1 Tax=Nocardioides nitrophenolicus TaxID=60489 RepID=UPI0019565C91|nr:FadR/GntR family transcriptional regulator [Nocardioides nitrophenolicus]MBM7517961.1 DNA-binding FadR family transcriptional regulator [Nocardioides nitrophenolicus]